MSNPPVPPTLAQAREQFLEMVSAIRPELHRYCARLVGSVVDGEDVVQDVLAKAFYHLSMLPEMPPLRPWLFRTAHNAAIDFCRRYERGHAEPLDEATVDAGAADPADPAATRAALAAFLELPPRQRSAVILKDVLGMSLEEISGVMEASIPAVKSSLFRGRERLRTDAPPEPSPEGGVPDFRAQLERLNQYAALFNAANWDGLRALLAEEVRLDMVSRSQRSGKLVSQYFTNYQKRPGVRLVPGLLEGRPALAAHDPGTSPRPAYFILLDWTGDKVTFIRDFSHVPYIAEGAVFQPR